MGNMISASDLINTAYIPLREGAGYIWGSYGQVHTKAAQQSATREQTVKWGSRWIGKRCWDCSGLVYWIMYVLYRVSMYHGSNTIWNKYCTDKGELIGGFRVDGEELKPGSAVFLYDPAKKNRHHIGIYVGNGKVIEAKGTYYGVVESNVDRWDEWGELIGVDYTGEVVTDMAGTIRPGMKGEDVTWLQETLNKLGYDCGKADGIFGNKTMNAVKDFQKDNGLTVDGIVGEQTMQAIKGMIYEPGDGDDDDDSSDKEEMKKQIALFVDALQDVVDGLRQMIQQ